MRSWIVTTTLCLVGCAGQGALARIAHDAERLRVDVRAPAVLAFLDGARALPHPPTRVFYRSADRQRVYDEAAAAALAPSERRTLKRIEANEEMFYEGLWGSPLAYARPIEILAAHGFATLAGQRILDFGYGDLGHLLLFAHAGATRVVGVDVDALYPPLYGPLLAGQSAVAIVNGTWPGDDKTRAAVGAPFDLIIAKNVLKRGYIHPERAAPPAQLIALGVDDETFLRALHDTLAPGGRLLLYNICPAPAPADKPYIPWADGRSPFAKDLYERAGLVVVGIDVDDSAAVRHMARTLGWDRGADRIDPDLDLFAWWTLVERPR